MVWVPEAVLEEGRGVKVKDRVASYWVDGCAGFTVKRFCCLSVSLQQLYVGLTYRMCMFTVITVSSVVSYC